MSHNPQEHLNWFEAHEGSKKKPGSLLPLEKRQRFFAFALSLRRSELHEVRRSIWFDLHLIVKWFNWSILQNHLQPAPPPHPHPLPTAAAVEAFGLVTSAGFKFWLDKQWGMCSRTKRQAALGTRECYVSKILFKPIKHSGSLSKNRRI